MKNKFLLLVACLGVLSSCNNDDNGGNNSTTNPVGTYKLTAFNISEAQDLNGDGTPSVNQMSETACLNESYMTLNADNTFTYDDKGIEIIMNGESESIGCYEDGDVTGTWSVSGTTLTLTYSFDGDVYNDVYAVSGSTITLTVPDGEAIGTTEQGAPVYVTTDINAVYTKQ
ncbi:hypothetical protein FLJC2902T_12860 [Flavobacterium limnosediminis JC2902]|uniref:Lipocalin-like domain-containing protein n=1 Tax=Flavobacterium limnosediminis JC2902 TaxID=1341181 RepID=V6SWB8_9FLAO|nr:lipocalin family protein [Flavobacterium limnosediminis]ESU28695.1 hypothetical protein FLJC2902T_12860 [Flavobacterium limnosediminis JC2902]